MCDLTSVICFIKHCAIFRSQRPFKLQKTWTNAACLIDRLIDWLTTIVIDSENIPWIIIIKLEFFPNQTCSHWSLWGYMTSNVSKWFYDVRTVNCSRECWPMTVVPHERSMIENGGMMTHILSIAVFCTFMSFFK